MTRSLMDRMFCRAECEGIQVKKIEFQTKS